MMNTDIFEQPEQEVKILDLLAKGEKEIAGGEGYDLEDVLLEADLLLMSLNPRNIRAIRG